MKFNWPLKSFNEELSNNFSLYKKFPDDTKSLLCGKFSKTVTLEDGITVEANKDISFIDFKYDQDDQEISIFFPGNNLECSKLLQSNISEKINALCRKIVINCFNGGFPLSLFNELKDLIHDESKWNHYTRDFEY